MEVGDEKRHRIEIRSRFFASSIYNDVDVGEVEKRKGRSFDLPSSKVAPRVGLEPTTCGLTVRRSTDWAIGESGNTNITELLRGLQVFLWKIFKIFLCSSWNQWLNLKNIFCCSVRIVFWGLVGSEKEFVIRFDWYSNGEIFSCLTVFRYNNRSSLDQSVVKQDITIAS